MLAPASGEASAAASAEAAASASAEAAAEAGAEAEAEEEAEAEAEAAAAAAEAEAEAEAEACDFFVYVMNRRDAVSGGRAWRDADARFSPPSLGRRVTVREGNAHLILLGVVVHVPPSLSNSIFFFSVGRFKI